MVISTTGIKVSPLYYVLWESIVVVYTYSTLFTNILTGQCTSGHRTLLMYKISDLYIPLTVFEILGFKLKNENDKKIFLISCWCMLLFTNM